MIATTDLTAAELVAVTATLVLVADLWSAASDETGGDWPEGACVETSIMLRDELREAAPTVGAEYVWGTIVIAGHEFGHAWVGLRDGSIADATVGQFLCAPPAYRLVRPGDVLAAYYHEQDRPAYA